MWLLIAFMIIPVIEIALFIQIGGLIGLWPTLAIVILTAILGTWLVRTQGALALSELRSSFSRQSDPTEPLAHGAMILIAGVLLLTPGFFTDALGLALLTPPVRRAVIAFLRKRVKVQSFASSPRPQDAPRTHSATTIEGDFFEVSPKNGEPRDPSGWTKD